MFTEYFKIGLADHVLRSLLQKTGKSAVRNQIAEIVGSVFDENKTRQRLDQRFQQRIGIVIFPLFFGNCRHILDRAENPRSVRVRFRQECGGPYGNTASCRHNWSDR